MDATAAAGIELRFLRGLALWQAAGECIEQDEAGYWLVPSGTEPGLVYHVSPTDYMCSCEDARYSGHIACKHAWAVRLHIAYLAAASRRVSREKVA